MYRTTETERKLGVDQLMKLRPSTDMLKLIRSHELQEQFGVEEVEE